MSFCTFIVCSLIALLKKSSLQIQYRHLALASNIHNWVLILIILEVASKATAIVKPGIHQRGEK